MNARAAYAARIAVDRGKTRPRDWAMAADGRMLDAARSDTGASRLTPAEFDPALPDIVEPWPRPLGGPRPPRGEGPMSLPPIAFLRGLQPDEALPVGEALIEAPEAALA